MLSRIAESLFWLGRYVERADDTARILDVYLHTVLEDPFVDTEAACRSLFSTLGVDVGERGATADQVLPRIAFDQDNPSAIAGAVYAARENARGVREAISSELWQCLNSTWNSLPSQRLSADRLGPDPFFAFVRERAAIVAGLAESTMSHDDGWRFLVLGRSLERVDMTTRLVSASLVAGENAPGWRTLLRACGAEQTFMRTYRGALDSRHVVEFLVLDRLFPRSVMHALSVAEQCLAEIDPDVARAGVSDPARRAVGRVRTGLEYVGTDDLLRFLPEHLTQLQQACWRASQAVAERYFQYAAPMAWAHEEG